MRWVHRASTARLESTMRSPLRAVLLWQIFATMCRRFDGDLEPELDAVIEFRIHRRGSLRVDHYRIAMAGGRCKRTRSRRTPAVALDTDAVSFLRLVGGAAAPAALLLSGKLKVHGDVLLGARLPRLLNIPRPSGGHHISRS